VRDPASPSLPLPETTCATQGAGLPLPAVVNQCSSPAEVPFVSGDGLVIEIGLPGPDVFFGELLQGLRWHGLLRVGDIDHFVLTQLARSLRLALPLVKVL
jgi:hypothetical protein